MLSPRQILHSAAALFVCPVKAVVFDVFHDDNTGICQCMTIFEKDHDWKPFEPISSLFTITFLFIVPLTIMVVSYLLVIRTISRQSKSKGFIATSSSANNFGKSTCTRAEQYTIHVHYAFITLTILHIICIIN